MHTALCYEKQYLQAASGNVRSITDKDSTTAERMTYYRLENKIESDGVVLKSVTAHSLVTDPEALKLYLGEKFKLGR